MRSIEREAIKPWIRGTGAGKLTYRVVRLGYHPNRPFSGCDPEGSRRKPSGWDQVPRINSGRLVERDLGSMPLAPT